MKRIEKAEHVGIEAFAFILISKVTCSAVILTANDNFTLSILRRGFTFFNKQFGIFSGFSFLIAEEISKLPWMIALTSVFVQAESDITDIDFMQLAK